MSDAQPGLHSTTAPQRIDVRGPRFVGGYTFVLSVAALFLALVRPLEPSFGARAVSPEALILFVLWLSFGAGTFLGNGAHPFAIVFRVLIRPRLRGTAEFDDPRPHRFALLIGFTLSTLGLVLHLVGVPYGLAVSAALLVVASFLQAFVGLCLGCQAYLLLVRAHVIGAGRAS